MNTPCNHCEAGHNFGHLLTAAADTRPNGRPLRLVGTQTSALGSGMGTIDTYVDGTGDSFTSIGGGTPVHTGSRKNRQRRHAARALGRKLRAAN